LRFSREKDLYKGRSRGAQSRLDRGITSKNGRPKAAKKGRPKSKAHLRLEVMAADAQMAGWVRYIENCRKNGTTPFVPPNVRRKLNLDD
jgi:hypothetical protein